METKFWTIFRPRSTVQLESHRYELFQAGKAPVRGELPVRGNGPSILDLYRQGKNDHDRSDRQERFRAVLNDEPAPPPAAPMTKQSGISRTNSTRTLGRRLSIKSTIRIPKKIKGLSKGKSSPDLKSEAPKMSVPKAPTPILTSHFDYNKFDDKPLPKLPSPPDPKNHRRKSTHIDLFDAVPIMKESQKDEAGRRNYGEDVADRNISMYGPESTRTSIDSRYHNRGSSDAGIAYSSSRRPADADWLNQPWVKEGSRPWEQARGKERRSSGARSTRSVRSLRQESAQDWPIKTRNRGKSDAGDALRTSESPDDADFELGAVTISDDIFYPG